MVIICWLNLLCVALSRSQGWRWLPWVCMWSGVTMCTSQLQILLRCVWKWGILITWFYIVLSLFRGEPFRICDMSDVNPSCCVWLHMRSVFLDYKVPVCMYWTVNKHHCTILSIVLVITMISGASHSFLLRDRINTFLGCVEFSLTGAVGFSRWLYW